ncbi:pyridoxal 5'-phosphate synthase [Pararhizobium sp. LjRoot255]|uniref:pyridoxal 5'-phosphate synthase n=1 Tax=Pararhizobium sp. LjRoot255 TaxID=3342298 RepID=UPI003ECC1985
MKHILEPVAAVPCTDIFLAEPENPLDAVKAWFDQAISAKVLEPGAMALTTLGVDRALSSRTIQVLEVGCDGLVFATHAGSPKGRDIAETGTVSGVFYWRELKQQVIVSGRAEVLCSAEAERLWLGRPRESCAMSIATRQSQPLLDEADLKARAAILSASSDRLERPAGWLGYLIRPTTVEFWQFSPDRLYKRLKYETTRSGWTRYRLQP